MAWEKYWPYEKSKKNKGCQKSLKKWPYGHVKKKIMGHNVKPEKNNGQRKNLKKRRKGT